MQFLRVRQHGSAGRSRFAAEMTPFGDEQQLRAGSVTQWVEIKQALIRFYILLRKPISSTPWMGHTHTHTHTHHSVNPHRARVNVG